MDLILNFAFNGTRYQKIINAKNVENNQPDVWIYIFEIDSIIFEVVAEKINNIISDKNMYINVFKSLESEEPCGRVTKIKVLYE